MVLMPSFNSPKTPEVPCRPAIPGRPSWGPARRVVDLAPGRLGRAARRVDRVAHLPRDLVDLLTRPFGRALLAADQRQQQAQHESENPQKIDFAFAHPRFPAWPYPHGRGQPRCARRSDDTEVRNPGRRATRRNRQRRQTRIPPGTDSVSARGTLHLIYYSWIRQADSGMEPADRSGGGAGTSG